MKTLGIILISILSLFKVEFGSLRDSFQKANLSHENAQKFYDETQNTKVSKKAFIVSAYQGAAIITLSKFQKDKKKKKELLTEGILKLEESIKDYPEEVELRLIRLIIQEKLPKFIKYNKNIEEDKNIILSKYDNQEADLKKWIEDYIKVSKSFSVEEKKRFSKQLFINE